MVGKVIGALIGGAATFFAAPFVLPYLGAAGLLGAAGTGTAISSLSGAALTSASCAAITGTIAGSQIAVGIGGAVAGLAIAPKHGYLYGVEIDLSNEAVKALLKTEEVKQLLAVLIARSL